MILRASILSLSILTFTRADAARAQAPVAVKLASYDIVGAVTDISSVPIQDVEVSVVKPKGFGKPAHTSKDGHFNIGGMPAGTISLQVRRLGYEARVVDVLMTADPVTRVEIVLKPIPEELEKLVVSAEEKSALREFYEHRAQRGSYGKFFDQNEIRKRGARYPSDLFRSIPGVTLASNGPIANAVRIRGCQPMLWIDGQRIPNSEVDDVVNANDIAGIEIYSSMAGTPAPYLDRSTRLCGTIIVWTKNR